MKGLTSSQATQFLNKYGPNVLIEPPKKNIFVKFIEQFNNFLTLLLLGATVISFLIGEKVDGILILAIVFLNAAFGVYQEKKAEEAISLLKKMTTLRVRVIRDGKEVEIDSRYLVPGDLIIVEEGVKIPADGQIVEARNLELNESALTGESLSVAKENKEGVYMGTIVVRGRGKILIKSTGMQTKFGQIAKGVGEIEDSKTPLQKKLEGLTRMIGISGIVISLLVFILSILQGSGYFPAFLLAISLAVAVVPEGLPAVMTITLAIGVKKMAEQKAIMRKLSAIEALGSITLIATDKTGTLTQNKMKVQLIYSDGSEENLSRVNSSLRSSNNNSRKFFPSPSSFNLLLLNGILCSTASLVHKLENGEPDVLGDPTEGALLYLAEESGLVIDDVRKSWKIIDEMPFDSVTKLMSVQAKNRKETLIFSKGAPESILSISNRILIGKKEENLTPQKVNEIEKAMQEWARRGLRVLAFAYKKDGSEKKLSRLNSSLRSSDSKSRNFFPSPSSNNLTIQQFNDDMIFLGMVAIHDPPRPEVVDAISRARNAGIKTVMITGDNEITAEAIGFTTGLIKKGDEIMTGSQIEKYSDEDLLKALPKVKIFARTTPFHKHRIVSLYQRLGEIVAVTGDGVNDAIALKQADVGIAMGLVGTDVARETADMVITDDNYTTIVKAVEEGRNIIKNLKNAIKYLLSCNVGEAAALTIGLALGLPTLFYPIQLLYINLITDGIPALALGFSPRQPHLMTIPPQKQMSLLEAFDKKYLLFVGLISAILVVFSYFFFEKYGVASAAAFSVLTLIQSFIFIDLWLSHKSIHKNISLLFYPTFVIAFIVPFALQFTIITHPFGAAIFKVQHVLPAHFFQFVILSALILIGIKVVKKLI